MSPRLESFLAWLDGLLEGARDDVDYYEGLEVDAFSTAALTGARRRLETLEQVRKRVVKVLGDGGDDDD